MRNPNRLFKIYDMMFDYHKKNPDLRMMQILNNFFTWHIMRYKTAGFYLEDDDFIIRFKEFTSELSGGN